MLILGKGEGEEDTSGRKGKGLVKEPIWMTHGHGQQCGDWLWEHVVGCVEKGKGGKIGTTVIEEQFKTK